MWTKNEEATLVSLYESHTDKELCEILNKTAGQIRGKKERMGLNSKIQTMSDDELTIIKDWYLSHTGVIDLDKLSTVLSRSKQTISRAARRMGLTNNSRPLSDESRQKMSDSLAQYRSTEYYINTVKPEQIATLAYYAQNNHPRGMNGKHHTLSTRLNMSKTHKELFANLPEREQRAIIDRMQSGLERSGGRRSRQTTFSRGNGGYRDDLGMYFRSNWEANFARVLNSIGVEWVYEPKRFHFPCESGIKSYLPDFYIPEFDVWVEIKGWMDDKSVKRLSLFEEYYPEESANLVVISAKEYNEIKNKYSHIVMWEN